MVFIRKEGKFLLGVESKETPIKGQWRLLGGKVDENETLEMAVHREIYEEAGISVKIIKQLGERKAYTWKDHKPLTVHIYLSDQMQGQPIPKLNEIGELKYFSLEESIGLDLDNISRSAFDEYKSII